MMRKLKFLGSWALATVLLFIAQTNADAFKWIILYEPETPDVLR